MEQGQIIELENGKRYVIADIVNFRRCDYFYIANIDKSYDLKFAKINGNDISFVEDDELFERLLFEVANRHINSPI